MLTIPLLLIAGIVLWLYFLWSRRKYYLLMLKLPGPMGLPLLGIGLDLITHKLKLSVYTKYYENYGPTIFTWMGPLPFLITRDPQTVEDILTSSECLNRTSHVADALLTNAGNGVLALQEPKWNERRKQMNPAFKHNVLLSLFPTFNAETDDLLTLLDSYVNQGEKDVLHDVLKWSFRISFQTTVGANIQQEDSFENDTLLQSFQSSLRLVTLNSLFPFTQIEVIALLTGIAKQRARNASAMNPVVDSIIQKKLNLKEETDTPLVIDQVIDSFRKGHMSLADMRGECIIMLIASFETTALSVYHALVLLAMHPQYQDTACEELKEVFPTTGDFDVSYEDLQKLVYLERVVNETLRLIPSIPIVPRENSKDFRLSSGVVIPKGVVLAVDIFHTNRNPDVWGPDATKFNPDHFLPENVRERHPYAYIPFSKSRRNCIGWRYALLSSRLSLAKILRNFKVSTSFRYEDLDFVENVGIKLVEEPRLTFERRT